MTRDDWIRAYLDELVRLRPHLQAGYGTNKAALAMAAQAYDPAVNPVTAARAVHARMGRHPAAKR